MPEGEAIAFRIANLSEKISLPLTMARLQELY
jgi:hypothetical protein